MQVRYEKLNTRTGGYLVTIRQDGEIIEKIPVRTITQVKKIRDSYRPRGLTIKEIMQKILEMKNAL